MRINKHEEADHRFMDRASVRAIKRIGCAFLFLFLSLSVFSAILSVHFIDVGQGDAILIQTPDGKNILIDGGPVEAFPTLDDYLRSQGVEVLEIVIATHPHADHIGGLSKIFAEYPVARVYMPRVSHTTVLYRNLLLAVREAGLKIQTARMDMDVTVEEGILFRLLGPVRDDYEELNNHSVVIYLAFQEVSFLFMGDAETDAEADLMKRKLIPDADVLKVAHHGSRSSTSEAFLKKVEPTYAVISCGKNNDYGHPHASVLKRLRLYASEVFRTDRNGTLLFETNGVALRISDKDGWLVLPSSFPSESESGLYIGNRKSKIFHVPSCAFLPDEKNRVYFSSVEEALNEGFRPCGLCRPLAREGKASGGNYPK